VPELCPLSPRVLRRCEVYALASCYWPLEEIDNAVNVAFLESGFQTAARNTRGEDSRGLWQINVAEGAHPARAMYNLFDPQINAYFAHQIWLGSGWRAWLNAARSLGLVK
jgi:hypothetical protein